MRVRILNSNTHAGQGLREGGLHRCADELDADVVTVQEVQRVAARARLRRQFPVGTWGIHGFMPPSVGPASAGNHVLWKKSMFRFESGVRDFISPQLHYGPNQRRDKWHPTRRLAQARLEVKGSGPTKRLAVQSDHVWTPGDPLHSGSTVIKDGIGKQCRAMANAAWEAKAHGYSVVCCGDYNAAVAPGDNHEPYIELQMRTHGMVQARPHNATKWHLDAAFISTDVRVISFDWIPKHLLTSDHDGFLLVVDI